MQEDLTKLIWLQKALEETDLIDQVTSFNFFEAAGMTTQEIRHSHFLAYLLDPQRNHGLGDRFVRDFIRHVSPDKYDCGFDDAIVSREVDRIDISLVSKSNNLALIIENKIWSGEHGDQLRRYFDIAESAFPSHKRILVFLSPEGKSASHAGYEVLSYGDIHGMLGLLVESGDHSDVAIAIRHYQTLLRRHLIQNSEADQLCRQIYAKHHEALDLIFEKVKVEDAKRKPQFFEGLAKSHELITGEVGARWVHFFPPEWKIFRDEQFSCEAQANPLIRFYFDIRQDQPVIRCNLRPPDSKSDWEKLERDRLISLIKDCPLFNERHRIRKQGWPNFYSFDLASDGDRDVFDPIERQRSIEAAFEDWVEHHLSALRDAVLTDP